MALWTCAFEQRRMSATSFIVRMFVSFRQGCVMGVEGVEFLEEVALRDPVVPVTDGFVFLFVGIEGGQLRKWNGQISALPSDEDDHIAGADVFGSEAADFYRFSSPQRRSRLSANAL